VRDKRVAIVTGASRGIGRGIAYELAKVDHVVVVNYASNEQAARDVQVAIETNHNGEAMVCQADVSQAADRERLVDTVLEKLGRIDLLVNNAGVAPLERKDILEATEESFTRVLDINLKGPYFLTQRVANEMIRLRQADAVPSAKIVNVSSISAFTSSPSRGEYCLSKAAVSMATQLWADRLAEFGINVYEVQPGVISTDMTSAVQAKYDKLIEDGLTPIRRWGQPSDIGKAVAAIAMDLLPFSTGEVIRVDGGFHMHRL
jgi:3-oxoacyl-[acyl-carrier protein] reductase